MVTSVHHKNHAKLAPSTDVVPPPPPEDVAPASLTAPPPPPWTRPMTSMTCDFAEMVGMTV